MKKPVLGFSALSLTLFACGGDQSLEVPGIEKEEWVAEALVEDLRFVSVRDVVHSDESIWVLDSAEPFLTHISLETGEVGQFGREGRGPGELLQPWAIQPPAQSDSPGILVWDYGAFRTSWFSSEGVLLETEPFPPAGHSLIRPNLHEVSYVDPHRVRRFGGKYVSVAFDQRINRTTDLRFGTLGLSESDLSHTHEILSLGELVSPSIESLKEWAEVPHWDSCAEDLVVWNPAHREFLWFGKDGVKERTTPFLLSSGPTGQRDLEAYLARMARLESGSPREVQAYPLQSVVHRARDRFSSVRPLVTDLRCEAQGWVWARQFNTENDPLGRSSEWVAVGPEGPSRHVRFPVGFTPFRFFPGGAVGSMTLSDGTQALSWAKPSATSHNN